MAEEIESIFPNEEISTYYVPYAPGEKNKRGSGPKGKLWSRYINVRTALRIANSSQQASIVTPKSPDENNPILVQHLDFLKVGTEPYNKILEAWEETFKLRKKIYLNCPLEKIYHDFPCMKLNFGIDLVSSE